MPIPFSAYHNVTTVQQQIKIVTLTQQGYRPISISIYGLPNDVHYAAVWVKRSGPAFQTAFGLSAQEYQKKFDEWIAGGYAVTLISATGAGTQARFFAVAEQGVTGSWFARHNLTDGAETDSNTFQANCRSAMNQGFALRSVTVYGDAVHPMYAGIWAQTAQPLQWNYNVARSLPELQKTLNAYTELPFRPGLITLSSSQTYVSVFRNDSIGDSVERHNLTGDEYQSEFNTWTAKGYLPISVQGGGSGNATRYAALFAKQDQPIERTWTVNGPNNPGLSAFDEAIKNYMQKMGIRAGALAISKNGVLKLQRGYTWAEPNYPVTQPKSLFRLASVSKAFTCAAIKTLYAAKKIAPDTKVFPLLGIATPALPSQKPDPRINSITVQNLVDHLGGWYRGIPFDPVFRMRVIAKQMSLSGPLTKTDLARFMYGEPLSFAPGTPQPGKDTYSNFGYLLLGMVVEKVTGQKYADYVRSTVLAPLGITDVSQARTLKSLRLPGEVTYEDPGLGGSALDPGSDTLVPYTYGGEGWMTEIMDSGGGLAASMPAVAQFAHTYLAYGLGARPAPGNWTWARSGAMAGTSSLVVSRGKDGVDYAFVFNTRYTPPGVSEDLSATLNHLLDTTLLP